MFKPIYIYANVSWTTAVMYAHDGCRWTYDRFLDCKAPMRYPKISSINFSPSFWNIVIPEWRIKFDRYGNGRSELEWACCLRPFFRWLSPQYCWGLWSEQESLGMSQWTKLVPNIPMALTFHGKTHVVFTQRRSMTTMLERLSNMRCVWCYQAIGLRVWLF